MNIQVCEEPACWCPCQERVGDRRSAGTEIDTEFCWTNVEIVDDSCEELPVSREPVSPQPLGVAVGIDVVGRPCVDVGREPSVERTAGSAARLQCNQDRRRRRPGALALVEQGQEVCGVLRDEDATVVDGPSEHVRIRRTAEPDVANMIRLVPPPSEHRRSPFAVHLVEQKLHPVNTEERAASSFRTRSAAASFSRILSSTSSRCAAA